ncbi:hypothetical protein [Kutzneria kofuensis]|uniref:Uncharacterized protein n=1 Tax=Kutzneria kofuensis TaxID=103725 RepID=A0A7W9NGA1_9PSEU|nr:hypothetical protein [Kutzneria kofuensis]MBB5892312.1 hypothetical protein [Kutzneria kofuensis]
METRRYPVIQEQRLDRAQRRLLGRQRTETELPRAEPGTVLVFEVESGYVAFTERRHLTGREDLVVNAVSVSVVDVRPRSVSVRLTIPSRSAADEFTVVVDFNCCVEDPQAVAAAGWTDLAEPLHTYLSQDAALRQLGAGHRVEEINEVREDVDARVRAYCTLRAPRLSGMSVKLAGVDVLTPEDLSQHARTMRDTEWRHAQQGLENDFEDRDATRLQGYFERGAQAVSALAARRGQLNLAEAAEREYQQLERKRADLLRLFESLPEAYRDTVAIDADRIINSVFDEIVGPNPTALGGDRAPDSIEGGAERGGPRA